MSGKTSKDFEELEKFCAQNFVDRMNHQLKNYPKESPKSKTGIVGNMVRLHDSGDFYSQEYIDKWHQIAQANPDKHKRARWPGIKITNEHTP
jgi:hypothetical protein